MKIVVFLPNWIGDAVMATPALAAIRNGYPAAEIVAVLRSYVGDVLTGTGLVDRVIEWNPGGENRADSGWRLARRLRRERFDVAVLMPNSLRSAWMAWLAGAGRRVGFDRDGRGWLLTDRLAAHPRRTPRPVLNDYLKLATHLGCRDLDPGMHLATTDEDEAAWDRERSAWAEHWGTRKYICLNPGGAFGAAKHWPVESFAELGNRMAVELDRGVVVLCGPSEREIATEIARRAGDPRVVSLAQAPLSLGLSKAAVRHAEALVTTDSGPRHFAGAFAVPVLTLFGATHIAWSETGCVSAMHLQLQVDCGPCQKPVCPQGHHRCMQDLSPTMVFTALKQLLAYPVVETRRVA